MHLIHDITSTADVVVLEEEIRGHRKKHPGAFLQHVRGVNLSFTAMGLAKLGISIQDCFKPNLAFEVGQETDALEHLGDPQDSTGLTTWQEIWKHRHIDGVLLVTAANQRALARAVEKVLKHLGHSILLLKRKNGSVRPDEQADHEHFGCLDSVSRPTVIGYNDARRAPGETASLPSAQRRQKEELDGE